MATDREPLAAVRGRVVVAAWLQDRSALLVEGRGDCRGKSECSADCESEAEEAASGRGAGAGHGVCAGAVGECSRVQVSVEQLVRECVRCLKGRGAKRGALAATDEIPLASRGASLYSQRCAMIYCIDLSG